MKCGVMCKKSNPSERYGMELGQSQQVLAMYLEPKKMKYSVTSALLFHLVSINFYTDIRCSKKIGTRET